MAFRTWGRLLLTALTVGVLAGAGQLGIAYGFGVVRLDGAFTDGSVNRWPAQLAWVVWFAVLAAVTGAVLTERFARRDGLPGGTTQRLAVAGAAALGATIVAPLCMQPARAAELGGTVDPVWAVSICALLGAVLGGCAAVAVLLKPPLGWNIALTAAVVWLLALVSAAPSMASTGPLVTVRLGVLEPSWLDPAAAQRLAMLILPTVALLAGGAVGALARRRGHLPLVGGVAGAAGPAVLAFAYLTSGPGDATDRYQLAPYYGALIAVAAGALGSAATTVLRQPATEPETAAIEPTDILQPLPPSPALPAASASATGSALAVPSHSAAADDAAGEPARPERARPAAATGGITPAHWDWSAPSGIAPAPASQRRARSVEDSRTGEPAAHAERTSPQVAAAVPPDRPGPDAPANREQTTGDDEPVARNGDEPTRQLPAPGLPPGRRTSAIDVLAAGHPAAPRTAERSGAARSTASAATAGAERRPARTAKADIAAPAKQTATTRTDAAGAAQPDTTREGAAERDASALRGSTPVETGQTAIEPPAGTEPAGVAPPAVAPAAPAPAASSRDGVPGGTHPADGQGATARRSARRPRRQPPAQAATAEAGAAPAGPKAESAPTADEATPTEPSTTGRPRNGSAPTADEATPAELSTTGRPRNGSAPTADEATPAELSTTGRSRRGRKARNESTATTPAEPTRDEAAPAAASPTGTAVPAPPEAAPARAAAAPARVEATHTSETLETQALDRQLEASPAPGGEPGPPTPAAASGRTTDLAGGPAQPTGGRERPARSYYLADEPAGPLLPAPVDASPSLRSPIVDEVAEGATPAAKPPLVPAPHPRHRALPDLGRDARWDPFANARQVTPAIPNAPQPGGRHADPTERATGVPAQPESSKARRGLFRRNRGKGDGELDVGHESEELAADEEYVDWVAGLASDGDGDGLRSLRSGRHHRE